MAETMGKIIKALRRQRGLTQEELAAAVGVTAQAVSKWENDTGMPDISQVVPLANFFGVKTDVLFGMAGEKRGDPIQEIIEGCRDMSSAEEYDALKKALREYPGDMRLLFQFLCAGQTLLSDGDALPKERREEVYEEAEKAGKLILSYSKDVKLLFDTAAWLVRLYCEMGDIEKASLTAETLPEDATFNYYAAYGRICEHGKRYLEAAKQYETNVSLYCRALTHTLLLCGNMYAHDDPKKALNTFCTTQTLCREFLKEYTLPLSNSCRTQIEKVLAKSGKSIEKLEKAD